METEDIWNEVKALQDGCLRTWAIYMQWYIWFYGASLIAMSLVVTTNNGNGVHGWPVAALAIVFNLLAVLSVIATITLGIYMNSVRARLDELSKRSMSVANLENLVGGVMGDYAWKGILVAFVVMIAAWITIGWHYH